MLVRGYKEELAIIHMPVFPLCWPAGFLVVNSWRQVDARPTGGDRSINLIYVTNQECESLVSFCSQLVSSRLGSEFHSIY